MKSKPLFFIILKVLFICSNFFTFSKTEIEQVLELFYEETGKYHTIDEIENFFKYPLELKKENSQAIADLLGVGKKFATKIVSLSNKGLEIEEICDSLNLFVSQCQLLKLCTKKAKKITSSNRKISDLMFDIKSRFYTNFSKNINFIGNSLDSYQRLFFRYKDVSAGFSFAKDIGELSFFDNKKYFVAYNGVEHNIVFGKFHYKNFWGNILGEPYGLNKGSNPSRVSFFNNSKLRPTLSTIEYGTFNGLAASSILNLSEKTSISITGFVSSTNRSGNFDTIRNVVTSIYTMDYYRDSSELKKKDILKENAFFVQLLGNFENNSLGYSLFLIKYDKPIQTISKKFISGTQNIYHSLFFEQRILDKLRFSAELSMDKTRNTGIFCGIKFLQKSFLTTLNFRYFSPNFRSPFGSMLGENSYPNNEFGVYYSLEYSKTNFIFQFYADYFKSLAPISLLQVPWYGNEEFIQFLLKLKEGWSTRFRLKREDKTDYVYDIQRTNQIPFQKVRYNFLFDNKVKIFESLLASQRLDFVKIDGKNYVPNESGFHISIDFVYTLDILKELEIGIRSNYYSTTSYSSAIYFFEIIAPEYMYSIPFYETGCRLSFWINWKFLQYFNLFVKYNSNFKNSMTKFFVLQLDVNYSF
ncbi:MAG: hypothetical protein N2560_06105 [Ignavibacteria bacterium]|nr:hypothetical protein [Ignavibacteria bacterium]